MKQLFLESVHKNFKLNKKIETKAKMWIEIYSCVKSDLFKDKQRISFWRTIFFSEEQ